MDSLGDTGKYGNLRNNWGFRRKEKYLNWMKFINVIDINFL